MSSSAGRIRGGYDDRSHLGGEAAYQGRLGATRLEPVHLALDDGRIRTLAVHVAVNVGSDPHLRDAALNGALHRFEGGEELALSYVFHDPIAKKLCVVVPPVLRHQVLDEHAKLLSAIAEDRDASVPAYVRAAEVVVGSHGLAAYLERPGLDAIRGERDLMEAQRTALEMERGGLERERNDLRRQLETERTEIERQRQLLGAQEAGQSDAIANERHALGQARSDLERDRAQLEQREHRVRERAEAVTTREDELREQGEQFEAQQRDLAMREQELEQRMEALAEREQAARRAEPAVERPKTVPPPAARAFKPTLSPPTSPIVSPVEASDDVEEIDELEPITTSPGKVAGERLSAPQIGDDAVEEIVDDEDVAEVEPEALEADDAEELEVDDLVPQEITGVHQDREESGPRTAIAVIDDLAGSATSSRMPSALSDAEMVAEVTDGVDLYVRLPEGVEGLGELDLLARLSPEEGPTAILELVGHSDGKRITRRAALDLRNEDDHGVLDQLRRRFEAAVHLFAHDGRPFDEARVAAPREVNAARIIDRGARLKTKLSSQAAKSHALARLAPEEESHPFAGDASEGELTAAAVLAILPPMAAALAPERLDHWLTVLSVPRDQIDAAVSRTIERAMTHGLALPTALIERALASAIVTDAAALVVRQIDAFRGTVLRPDRGHLDEAQIAENWELLLKAAADNEVALDSETHDLAFRAIRTVKGDDTGSHPADVDPDKFGELDPPQLVMMLEHPRYRCAAAIALSDRKDAAFADVLCKAVRKMPRHEVVRVMPRLVALGEEAGDALIDGLGARKTFVRQGFALVLGHLKLRRAVVPLLHRLMEEESDVHLELSRVVGSFGNASFRPFARQLNDAKASGDRVALTLAHLANAGCEKQVGELKKDGEPRTKELATRALTMLGDARAQEEKVTGKRALDDGDSVLAFSRRFEEELRGEAPTGDLAAAPGEE